MMYYLILAQICLTVGTPNWVVVLCYVCVALRGINTLAEVIKEAVAKTLEE